MGRMILLVSVAMILGGCVTPVIPLPPPRFDRLSFSLSGTSVVIEGAADANLSGSWIFVVNSRAGRGAMVNAADDGSFKTDPIPGVEDRDKIHLWAAPSYYEATGDVTCIVLDFASKKPARCSP